MRIGWLSTGRDAAARTLLSEVVRRAARDGVELDIPVVFCDRARGESAESDAFLDLVGTLGLTAATLSSATSWRAWRERPDTPDPGRFRNRAAARDAWRDAYHADVAQILGPYEVDLLILAGYMLIASPDMCERFLMLNLHPALPGGPQGTWQEVIWQLMETEAQETGVMMHFATAELDRGPVLAYCSFPIVGFRYDRLWYAFRKKRDALGLDGVKAAEAEREPLFAEIRRQGERREIPLLYHTVREFAQEHLIVRHGEVVEVSAHLPLALNDEVEAELEAEERKGERP
jgi:phosphoribosylglycinamide formyltransferase-1